MEEKDTKNTELIAAVEAVLSDPKIIKTFGLTKAEMKSLLAVKVTDTGFDVSPNFQSAGFGENETDSLVINLSDLGNGKPVLEHELKHAMHCLVCASVFTGHNIVENFNEFCESVINDPGFHEWREKFSKDFAESQWNEVLEMMESADLTATEIKKKAVMLGSILYQHAYFVDPTICEAVASTNDIGFVRVNGMLNRAAGLLIPGDQFIEGYGWEEAENAFAKSPEKKKALMIRKNDYVRDEYFGLKHQ